MANMQPVCSSGNKIKVSFCPKVEFTKMKIKTFYIRFFKDSLNKRAPTLELVKSNVSTFK